MNESAHSPLVIQSSERSLVFLLPVHVFPTTHYKVLVMKRGIGT